MWGVAQDEEEELLRGEGIRGAEGWRAKGRKWKNKGELDSSEAQEHGVEMEERRKRGEQLSPPA